MHAQLKPSVVLSAAEAQVQSYVTDFCSALRGSLLN